MKGKTQLNSEERYFFSLVNRAAIANPFSDEREQIDLEIAGLFPGISREKSVDEAIARVRDRIQDFEHQNRSSLHQFDQNDRDLMQNAFLFDFFHLFLKRFDQYILDQIDQGPKVKKVDFAHQAFAYLADKGFTLDDSRHYFALCFQMRRAFFFIKTGLVGRSPAMKNLKRSLWNNVFTYNIDLYNQFLLNRMEDFSTLILGETGTGKGTAAMAIGRSGFIPYDEKNQTFVESFTESFVSMNLSQFSQALIESELFGHKKGAFTGAVEDHTGIFNRCSPFGSIFLDEIGEVSPQVQIKLLKVLEERIFNPVGSHKPNQFKGRIIAATNRPIEDIIDRKVLREDFFYRLCSDIIIVPPLRQRLEQDPLELDDLLAHAVERIIGSPSAMITKKVKAVIENQIGRHYHWPGNVRELGQAVRGILLNNAYIVRHQNPVVSSMGNLAHRMEEGGIDAQTLLQAYCHMLYETYGTYGEVSRRTKLDRRTVKKYVDNWSGQIP